MPLPISKVKHNHIFISSRKPPVTRQQEQANTKRAHAQTQWPAPTPTHLTSSCSPLAYPSHAPSAAARLAASQEEVLQPFSRHQAYLVDGLGPTAVQVLAVADLGIPLRGFVWAHTTAPIGEQQLY